MTNQTHKIGILGTGWIAEQMAKTLAPLAGYECIAVASRSDAKANAFAKTFGIPRAYGSYEALAADPEVELIYVATPHSHHYQNSMMCLEHGKPVLCEKAFTANAAEAEALLNFAHERKIFITEAIWTRYMPLSLKVIDLVKNGAIGRPYTLSANLCYPNQHLDRMRNPMLCGGALLDLGVYTLNFAAMIFGDKPLQTTGVCSKFDTGVDDQCTITQFFSDNRMASLFCSQYPRSDRKGIVSGDGGYIVVENINCPEVAHVYDLDYRLVSEHFAPAHITGYEYQVIASFEAMSQGLIESPYMPHAETIRIMRLMDDLRKDWGVVYPNDEVLK